MLAAVLIIEPSEAATIVFGALWDYFSWCWFSKRYLATYFAFLGYLLLIYPCWLCKYPGTCCAGTIQIHLAHSGNAMQRLLVQVQKELTVLSKSNITRFLSLSLSPDPSVFLWCNKLQTSCLKCQLSTGHYLSCSAIHSHWICVLCQKDLF